MGRYLAITALLLAAQIAPARAQQRPPATGAEDVRTPQELVTEALQLIETGDPDRAAALIQRAGILDPSLDELKLAEGLLYMQIGRNAEALLRLEEFNKTKPGANDYRGHLAVGRIYKLSYNYRLAANPLKDAKRIAVNQDPEIRAQIGMDYAYVLLGMNNKEDALDEAKQAGRLAPNDAKAQTTFAEVAKEAREYELALTAANRAINITLSKLDTQPFDVEAHGLLQKCYRLKADLFIEQIKERRNEAVLYFQLAETMRQSGDVDRRVNLLNARETALQAADLDKTSVDAPILVAQIEADLGAYDDALIRIENVLKTNPDHPGATSIKQQLDAAITARQSQ